MGISAADELARAVTAVLDAGPPGAHLSVAIAGGRRWDVCRGQAQVFDAAGPAPCPLSPRHFHDLGSVTKIAGTVSMLAALVSRGLVSVDDEVGRYVPGLSAPLSGATLADLLRHRAGLWEWWPTYVCDGDPIATIAALPLRYPPRTGRHYSDLGFMLLGRVAEAVTSQPIPAAHRELVTSRLAGLGAEELCYTRPPADRPVAASSLGDRIEEQMIVTGKPYPVTVDAAGFTRWRRHVLVGEVNDGNAFHSFGGAAGHAGLFATVDGLHALGAAMLTSLSGGGPWPALAQFLVPGPDPGQLLGFRRWEVPAGDGGTDCAGVTGPGAACVAEMIGHAGFPGIGFAFVPRHDATVVLATNRLHVRGEAAAFDPLWQRALVAAHRALHAGDVAEGATTGGDEGGVVENGGGGSDRAAGRAQA